MAASKGLGSLLLRLLLLSVLAGGSYLLLLYACLDRNPASNNYNAAQIDKQELLAKTPTPRLIVIGGSNLAFGLDSQRLEQALGVHVVNLGHQASLGLRYMMGSVRRLAKPGDWVLLVPEYEHLGQDIFYGGSAVIDLAGYTGNLALLRYNGPVGLLAANTAIRYYQQPFTYYPPYTRDSFNRYGDNIAHLGLPPSRIASYTISPAVNPAPIRAIKAFSNECSRRGIRLLISYPATMRSFYESNRTIIAKLSGNLQNTGVTMLDSNPESFVFDDRYFFDTVYHLTAEGRALRTERLTRLLQQRPELLQTDEHRKVGAP